MKCRLEIIVCFEELLQPRENHSVTEGFFYLLKWFSRTHILEAIHIISDMHNFTLVFLQYRFDVISFQRPALIKRQCNSSVFLHFEDDFLLQWRNAFAAVFLSEHADQDFSSSILRINRVPFSIGDWSNNYIAQHQIEIILIVELFVELCQRYQILIVDELSFELGWAMPLDQINFANGILDDASFGTQGSLNKLFISLRSSFGENTILDSNPFICLLESLAAFVVVEFDPNMLEVRATKRAMNFWWLVSTNQIGWFRWRTSLFGFVQSAITIIVALTCQFLKLCLLYGAYSVVIKLTPLVAAINICFIMSCVGGFAVAMKNEGNKLIITIIDGNL